MPRADRIDGDSRRFKGNHYLSRDSENTGLDALHRDNLAAQLASRELKDATHSLFRKWERENGFVEGAGQILLLAGWRSQ